jgi:RNA polymerase sigma-70 factor (ECF subfamily)
MLQVVQLADGGNELLEQALMETRTFEAFFEAEAKILFRRFCVITADRFEAEEVTQDAFVAVLERWDRVSAMDDPVGYLYQVAFNVLRKRRRRAVLALRRTAAPDAVRDEFAAADARHVVTENLARLTPRQRAALVLTELMGYTSEAAGRMLGVRAATVRALATQGRAAMRRGMRSEDE